MNRHSHEVFYEHLAKRRGQVTRTLDHVRQEQRTVGDNRDWIDRAAYASRVDLLDNLIDWYLEEAARIDDALSRIAQGKYGFCAACHEPIEPRRLEAAPDAVFCVECQRNRDELSSP